MNKFFLTGHKNKARESFLLRPGRSLILVVLAVIILIGSSCASNKPHKRLKKGKPIPCPMKDC